MVLTSDPIIPPTAYETDPVVGRHDQRVWWRPTASSASCRTTRARPRDATAVMYTEKELNYYLAGDSTNASGARLGNQ